MRTARRVVEWVLLVAAAVVVAALLFVDVGPRLFSYQALVVRSGSMTPTIPTGSLIVYKRVAASQLKVGDIIAFNEPGATGTVVTHRIYAVHSGAGGSWFVTKGDANPVPDSWRVPAVGSGWEAVWHAPDLGYIVWDLETGGVRVLFIVVPLALLAGLGISDRWRSKRGRAHTVSAPEPW